MAVAAPCNWTCVSRNFTRILVDRGDWRSPKPAFSDRCSPAIHGSCMQHVKTTSFDAWPPKKTKGSTITSSRCSTRDRENRCCWMMVISAGSRVREDRNQEPKLYWLSATENCHLASPHRSLFVICSIPESRHVLLDIFAKRVLSKILRHTRFAENKFYQTRDSADDHN